MTKVIATRPSQHALEELGVKNWPMQSSEVAIYPQHYEEKETCYLLEGEADIVVGEDRMTVHAGDLVIFSAGMDCIWEVHHPITKRYQVGKLACTE